MAEHQTTLATFFNGWQNYQKLLISALAPLSAAQLTWCPAPHMRSLSNIVCHMIGARARWFHELMDIGGEAFVDFSRWDRSDTPQREVADLISALETTWQVMQAAITGWTDEDWQTTYEDEEEDHVITRQWIIWHLLEHDLHHGGEFSLILGVHGLKAPDL